MKKTVRILFVSSLAILNSCAEKDSTFLITENSVGGLLQNTPVEDIGTIFTKDSIVRDTLHLNIGAINEKIKIYERGGNHLLTLTPNEDSIPTIGNIRIFDSRYESDKGIGLQSTFKQIKESYNIRKIVTTLNSIVIFPEESNLYFTIDKGDLPSSLRYASANIEAVQIPDDSKIKYLMIGWD